MSQSLVILQGASGSGKSSFAEFLFISHVVCSTDHYFGSPPNYQFVPSKLGEAHAWNQERVKNYLSHGESVVVDNTNIHAWEAKPYVQMAVELGISVVFVRCTGKFQNTHGVPDKVVERMRGNMEELSVEKCLAAKAPWEK